MSALILKIVACVTMLCDHIGYHNGTEWLRMIGRVALPIFAYMIATGYKKTRDPYKYLLRILVFAVITEPIFDLCFYGKASYPLSNNVLFSLSLGLIAVILLDHMKYRFPISVLSLLPVGIICYVAEQVNIDYGMWVVILIVLYYLFDGESVFCKVMTGSVTIAFGARFVLLYYTKSALYTISTIAPWLSFLSNGAPRSVSSWETMQIYAAFSALFILLYNKKPGIVINNKYLRLVYQYAFYAFYPVHMFIILLFVR